MSETNLARARRVQSAAPVRLAQLTLLLAVAPGTGYAQDTSAASPGSTALPPISITGTRLPVTPSGLAQSVTVIDQRQIQENNPARLEDILQRVTAVYVDQAGRGGFTSLYLRGAENSHLLVMIDGVKMNDPTTTRGSAYDLSSIDVSQIERIELLRGPASAIHGGEALSGVLNIITKKRAVSGFEGSAYAGAGEDGYRKIGGAVALGNDAVSGQLRVGQSRDGSSSDDARLRLDTFSGSLRIAPVAGVDGDLFFHRGKRKSEAFPDDSGGPRLAVNRAKTVRDATDTVYGGQFAVGELSAVRFQGGVSVFDRKEDADNAAVDPGVRFPVPAFTSATDYRRTTVNATGTHLWEGGSSVVVGVEHQKEDGGLTSVGDFDFDGNPETLDFRLKRTTKSVFAEGRFQLSRAVAVQIGLRHDKVEGLKAETTPHLGVVWELPNGVTTLKASYSEGFKPPSFFALGFPIGANPDLKPERSRNLEFTAVHRLDGERTAVQASVFRINYKDLVDFVVDPNSFVPLNVNRGLVVVTGIEPALKWQVMNRLKVQLGLTLLDINERDGLAPLRNRPEKKATALAVYDFDERSSLFGVLNYSGHFLDRSNPTADITLGGYATVDLSYSIKLGSVQGKLAVDNLFDRHYEQFVGFPAQQRRVRVELRTTF